MYNNISKKDKFVFSVYHFIWVADNAQNNQTKFIKKKKRNGRIKNITEKESKCATDIKKTV